jgi:hypothetical protein
MTALARRLGAAEIAAHTVSVMDPSAFRNALSVCLEGALELGRGAALLETHKLTACQVLIARALHERFVRAAWVATSETNAAAFLAEGRREILRQARKLAGLGLGKFVHKKTKADLTQMVVTRINALGVKPPVGFEQLARDAGVSGIHRLFYGNFSVFAHGHALGTQAGGVSLHDASLAANAGYIEAITAITLNRLVEGRTTTPGELKAILRLPPT